MSSSPRQLLEVHRLDSIGADDLRRVGGGAVAAMVTTGLAAILDVELRDSTDGCCHQ